MPIDPLPPGTDATSIRNGWLELVRAASLFLT
jgi:hypothetical protein